MVKFRTGQVWVGRVMTTEGVVVRLDAVRWWPGKKMPTAEVTVLVGARNQGQTTTMQIRSLYYNYELRHDV